MTGGKTGRRPYLSRNARRHSLLAVAADIVENRGWSALTMVSLADQAGVSRQLVYQHFDSLQRMIGDTIRYIFEDVYLRTRDEIVNRPPDDVSQTIVALQRITFDIPVGRARALWQVISAPGTGEGEIVSFSRYLRQLLIKTAQPLIESGIGVTPEQAAPLTWMLMVGFWGARLLTDDGELSREDAIKLYSWMVDRVLLANPDEPPPTLTSMATKGRKSSAKKDKKPVESEAKSKRKVSARHSTTKK